MGSHPTNKIGSRTIWRIIGMAALVFLLSDTARAVTVSVNCDSGGSINAALAGLDNEGPNRINVTGTCHEDVVISNRERLTVAGPATIISPDGSNEIFVFRSRGIDLLRLTLTGGFTGLFVRRSEVVMNFCTIQNNSGTGVFVSELSSLTWNGNLVQNNTGNGITVNQTSRLGVGAGGNTIQNNAGTGINVANGSSAQIINDTIQNNGGGGINVFNGSNSNIVGGTIQNNTGTGIIAFHTSMYQLIGSTVTGNSSTGVRVSETSHAEIVGNIIHNNGAADPTSPGGVMLSEGGEAFIDAGNDISNNTGPGILVTAHGTLSSTCGNIITNNTAEGVKLRLKSLVQFFAADTISGNGGPNLACDRSSLAAGDLTGVTKIRCEIEENEDHDGPRKPHRPELGGEKED